MFYNGAAFNRTSRWHDKWEADCLLGSHLVFMACVLPYKWMEEMDSQKVLVYGHWVKLIESKWRIYASVNYAIIGSDNGLSPGRGQAIIWINAGTLLIWTLDTKFSEILCEIHTFSFKKMHFSMTSGKCWQFCLGLNVLRIAVRFCQISPTILNDVMWSQQVIWKYWYIDIEIKRNFKEGMSNLSDMFVFADGPATGQRTIHAHNFWECIVHFDLFCWYRSSWWELFKHILQGCLILVGTSKVTQKHMGKINCVLTHLPWTK